MKIAAALVLLYLAYALVSGAALDRTQTTPGASRGEH